MVVLYSFVYIFLPLSIAQITTDEDKLLNWCLDGKFHKKEPGPESELFSQCTPWRNKSCCTYNTTEAIHQSSLYSFNYNHCSHKKNMSANCKKHFIQDFCFFECSPNIGPWVVQVDMKTRKERFYHVPLCRSDCEVWFDSCREDYTCADDWYRNFSWYKDGNHCKPGSECQTFQEIFKTAENFCQKVWDGSWVVTDNEKSCMRIWFNDSIGNPNEAVAKYRVKQIQQHMHRRNIGVNNSSSFLLVFGCIWLFFKLL